MTEQTLVIPKQKMDEILREFQTLPVLTHSGKIVLQFEINCGMGGTIGDIELFRSVRRKSR